jgi:hypothetical protein
MVAKQAPDFFSGFYAVSTKNGHTSPFELKMAPKNM